MNRRFWGRKSICLMTGASQNLARHMAQHMAPLLGPQSVLILTSRHADRLGPLRQEMYEQNCNLRVHLLEWDLAYPSFDRFVDDLKAIELAYDLRDERFELGLIVHNASALSVIDKPVIEMDDAQSLQELLNINVISMVLTNAAFWKVFKDSHEKVIVNMTAPLTDTNAPSLGLLCVGRTSRQMVLNVLALENPEIKVLHFQPGHLDTSWLHTVMNNAKCEQVKRQLQSMFEENRVLKAEAVAAAFLRYLASNEIESGSVVDARQVLRG
ncbi:hypothetical protein M514_04131, partial [Trichuris suis]